MKSIYKRIFICLSFTLLLSLSGSFTSYAAELHTFNDPSLVIYSNSSIAVPLSDNIVWRYRSINGKRQKRRWNETRHIWVDPDWIDIE